MPISESQLATLHCLHSKLASLLRERDLPASVRAVLHAYSREITDEFQRRQKRTVGEESFAGLVSQEPPIALRAPSDALTTNADELFPGDDTWPPRGLRIVR